MIKMSCLDCVEHTFCILINVFFCSDACAIELEDTVVVTGGAGPTINPLATVQVYTISGHLEQLPDMTTPRKSHACAHFRDSGDRVVSI